MKKIAISSGAYGAVICDHWAKGGFGAKELAEAVVKACDSKSNFKFLYENDLSIVQKIEKVSMEMYGAASVSFSEKALEKIAKFEKFVAFH